MDVFILDSATLEKIGVVDQSYSSLRWTRRLYAPDSFEMIINRRRLYASELKTKRLLFMPSEGNLCFFIEQTGVRFEGSQAGDLVKVRGRSIEGPALTKRRVIPPTGQSHDRQTSVAAETAIKHYVDAHAGPGAAVARRIPNLAIAADQARGITVTVEARHQAVADILRETGLAAAMGWQITLDQAAASYIFDVVVGVDRSTSVFFDPAFETLEAWEELDSIADSDTVAYVAGQGEGVDREIVTRWRGVEPTGFDRREVFLDARDVELGLTAVLNHRGDAHLEATAPEIRYEAKVHQFGSFRYRTDWDLGDLIRLRNEERGISQSARVVEVESVVDRSSTAPERTAVLDRPFPTLKDRVRGGGIGGVSVQDRPGSVPAGVLGYATVTANQLGIGTAATDLTGLSVTVTVGTSRRIKISVRGVMVQLTSAGVIVGNIQEGAVILGRFVRNEMDAGKGILVQSSFVVDAPSAGVHTYKLTARTTAGTLDWITSGSDAPGFVLVEDIGPAA